MSPRLIFFGHDALDAAVRRRIRSFEEEGVCVTGFTMRRGPAASVPWDNVDLGRTHDANFSQRLHRLAAAMPVLASRRRLLANADIYYARNLDMLVLAHLAKTLAQSRARIVYECLDVHRFLTRPNWIGCALRGVEQALLVRTALVVISSPAFAREYFERHHGGYYRARVIENRLPRGYCYGPRSTFPAPDAGARPLRIGWFGNLRCRRSLSLLLATAERFRDRVRIILSGVPARTELPDLESQVSHHANVEFRGRYEWPADLASLYGEIDLVWAGDFHDQGANSAWLLPNRLYEGGYFGTPPVTPEESETGRWIEERGAGFTLSEPLELSVPAFFGAIGHTAVAEARARLLALPDDLFVQPPDEMKRLLVEVLATR